MKNEDYKKQFEELDENIKKWEEDRLRKKAQIEKQKEEEKIQDVEERINNTLDKNSDQSMVDYFLFRIFKFGAIDSEKLLKRIKKKTGFAKKILEKRMGEIIEEINKKQYEQNDEKGEGKEERNTEELKYLKNKAEELGRKGDLLYQICETMSNPPINHKGDNEAKVAGLLSCLIGGMVIITGESSSGKSDMANAITSLMPDGSVKKIGASSKQALKHELKKLSDNKNFSLLYVQEMQGAENILQDLKLMSSDDKGFTFMVSEKDELGNWVTNEYDIPAKGFLTTSTKVEFDQEFMTRALRLSVDESEELTKKVVFGKLDEDNQLKREKQDERARILPILFENIDTDLSIHVPWTDVIKNHLPDVFFKKVRVRRDIDKFKSFYKTSALIHQKQRPVIKDNKNGNIVVATPEDLYNAIVLGEEILKQTMTGMDPRLRKTLDVCKELKGKGKDITSNNVGKKLEKSANTAYKWLTTLSNLGLLDNTNPGKGNKNKYEVRSESDGEFLSVLNQNSVFLDCLKKTREALNNSSSPLHGNMVKDNLKLINPISAEVKYISPNTPDEVKNYKQSNESGDMGATDSGEFLSELNQNFDRTEDEKKNFSAEKNKGKTKTQEEMLEEKDKGYKEFKDKIRENKKKEEEKEEVMAKCKQCKTTDKCYETKNGYLCMECYRFFGG